MFGVLLGVLLDTLEELQNSVGNTEAGSELEFGAELGSGGFGTVYKVTDNFTGLVYAAKVFPAEDEQYIQRELQVASRIRHPHIVEFQKITRHRGDLVVVMELALSSLRDLYIKQAVLESSLSRYAAQILEALEYLHSLRLVHRDIKAANILLFSQEAVCKLSDFGCVCELRDEQTHLPTFCGSLQFIAPEVARGHRATYSSDVWSLGATVAEVMLRNPPFDHLGSNAMAVFSTIATYEGTPPLHPDLSMSAAGMDFVRLTLATQADRPTTAALLQHRWLVHPA